jgi:hypothetical protein
MQNNICVFSPGFFSSLSGATVGLQGKIQLCRGHITATCAADKKPHYAVIMSFI